MNETAQGLSLCVVIPVFNESGAVGEVVENIREVLDGCGLSRSEILVVDDGSSDKSAEIAEKSGARVIRHPVNMGYGRTLLTGFSATDCDWILTIDADGSYPATDIPKLLEFAPECDMVIGARKGKNFWGSPMKGFLRWIQLRISTFVAGVPIPDANSGIRLFRRSLLAESLPVRCYGYSLSTTMTLSFIQKAHFVRFVPVSYDARKGSSKVRMLRDTLRTLQLMTEVMLYFNPLKFAVALACLPLAGAAVFGARFACQRAGSDLAWTGFYLTASLFVFIMGCLFDVIRLHANRHGQ